MHCWPKEELPTQRNDVQTRLVLVDPERLESSLEGLGGRHEVVVRDLREEEMVCHVAVRDMMHELVDSETIGSERGRRRPSVCELSPVDGLHLSLDECPGPVLVDRDIV